MTTSPPRSLARPSDARVHNYLLGGTHNWAVDRDFADHLLGTYPQMRRMARASLLFADSTVRRLLDLGVRQFLDVGSGVPSSGAIHHVADEVDTCRDPDSGFRVVYVDNDTTAVAHAQLHLDKCGDDERHAVIAADLRAPTDLWADAVDTDLIDPSRPVGVLLVSVLHIQQLGMDGEDVGPHSVARLCSLLPKGSFVAVSHIVNTGIPTEVRIGLERVQEIYDSAGLSVIWRTRREVNDLLKGLDMVDPGWQWVTDHDRPEFEVGISALPRVSFGSARDSAIWAGVARIPE